MHYRRLMPLLVWLCAAVAAGANPANGDPRKEKLYSMFIAPCCWRENLLAHHSPKADELRAGIDAMITSGLTDDEIKAGLVNRHTLRILALPEGARGQWLAWATPVIVALGASGLLFFIRRSVRTPPPARVPAGPLPDLPESY